MRNLKNEICFCLHNPDWVESIYASEKYELILKKVPRSSPMSDTGGSNLKINTTIPLAIINQSPVIAVSVRDTTLPIPSGLTHFCLLGSIFYVSQTPDIIDFRFDNASSDWLQKTSELSESEIHNNIIELLEQLFTFMDIVDMKSSGTTQNT